MAKVRKPKISLAKKHGGTRIKGGTVIVSGGGVRKKLTKAQQAKKGTQAVSQSKGSTAHTVGTRDEELARELERLGI